VSFVLVAGLYKPLSQGATTMGLFDKLKKTPEQEAKYQAKLAEIKAKKEERQTNIQAKKRGSNVDIASMLVMPLKDKGEKIFSENVSSNEKILVKLQGDSGQALVMTDKRLYIIKWGFMANQTFGSKSTAYEYKMINALEFKKKMSNRYIQILTAATQANVAISIWDRDKDGGNAKASDSVVTYIGDKKKDIQFQAAVNLGRQLISQAHGATTPSQDDSLAKLEQLASLKERGIITEQDFQAKKRQLLGL
jgi:hypothetical protein